jgi:hypothetical protein
MRSSTLIPASLALGLLVACAPVQPPKPDPLKEDVIILQKQLLELQRLQNETKARLEESNNALAALAGKVHALEGRQTVRVNGQAGTEHKPAGLGPEKKPPKQKKQSAKKTRKKVRRQE